ncbi:flagellar biosynthetic protein FliR [Petrocella sp. FN5]|uniref:flagellar biosynthetic protein FliR n=1 Tax=Petrocella sp. FN5 TaxID=3032002 RepID=UPI0023DAFD75|nr:flagellar biosynthetic protein FliR [Petrocella sp. FN5]MDF1616812.1 flagellar biosynthetic protein FliR [Petrocella sp. FN5]
MQLLLSDPYMFLDALLLVFVRALGLLLIVPVFGNRSVPYMAKIAVTFFLSVILLATIPFELTVSSTDVVNFAAIVVKEFLIGWLIGFGAYIVFSIVTLSGQFIDAQIGFSMVNVFDPASQIQLTITGNLYYYLLIMITLMTNAHHMFLRALINSYHLIPLGEMSLSNQLYSSIVEYLHMYFVLALQIASPIFFVMIITNVVLGVLARAVPQLNMFVIGFPIKILLGLITIYLTLALFSIISDVLIGDAEKLMQDIIEGLMPR